MEKSSEEDASSEDIVEDSTIQDEDIVSTELVEIDVSIANQSLGLIKELIGLPEEILALVEVNKRSAFSNIAYEDPNTGLPYRKTLSTFMRDESLKAIQEWNTWIEIIQKTGKTFKDLIYTENEIKEIKDLESFVLEEEKIWKENNEIAAYRAISETPGFLHTTVPANDSPYKYRLSSKESLENYNRQFHETQVWRKAYREEEEDKLLPNIGPEDDPDYITSLDISSLVFYTYTPTSRAYDATYKISFKNKTELIVAHIRGERDYTTTESFVEKLLTERGKGSSIDKIELLSASWEVDVRESPGDKPDPRNYRKVPNEFKAAQAFLRYLDDVSPNIREVSWMFENKKKVSLCWTVSINNVTRTYWTYLKEEQIGTPRFLKPRRANPSKKEFFLRVLRDDEYKTELAGYKYVVPKSFRQVGNKYITASKFYQSLFAEEKYQDFVFSSMKVSPHDSNYFTFTVLKKEFLKRKIP